MVNVFGFQNYVASVSLDVCNLFSRMHTDRRSGEKRLNYTGHEIIFGVTPKEMGGQTAALSTT